MTVKSSGRSVLILAIGLLVCFLAPLLAPCRLHAEPNSASASAQGPVSPNLEPLTPAPQRAHHLKKTALAHSGKVALKPPASKKSLNVDGASAVPDGASAIPPAVANANAELTSTLPVDSASGLAARANQLANQPSADQIASPDQLNDLDRALQASTSPAPTETMAATGAAAASADLIAYSDDESSNGDRASLIGKIFIGIGVLLTLGSVARMFMA